MYQDLFSRLTPNATIITPSQRLAKHLLTAYADFNHQQGKYVWPAPRIIPLAQWLESLWELIAQLPNFTAHKRLSAAQELLVWEQAVKKSPLSELLLRPVETAKSAMQAWHAIMEWEIPVSELHAYATIDTQALLSFADSVQQLCAKQQWLMHADLITLRLKYLTQIPRADLPDTLIFYAFESLTPSVTSVLTQLARQDIEIIHEAPITINIPIGNEPIRYAFDDDINEWQSIARWAQQLVLQGEKNIGIIAANLNEAWPSIEQVFTTTLLPESLFNSQLIAKRPFNMSGGGALAQMPVVASALHIIQFFCEPLAIESLPDFLSSPFLGASISEQSERVQLVELLFQKGYLTISFEKLLAFCQKQACCPLLEQQLNAAQSYWQPQTLYKKQAASDWAQVFQSVLTAMGWPGERVISSAEYQAIEHFLQVMQEFITISEVQPQLSARYACSLLQRALQNAVFQIQTENKPIQILGPLEAAGLCFDHLWIMGLTDQKWPGLPSPYPFIPIVLQHRYQLPHTSSAGELTWARCLTERFLQAAPLVILSHAASNAQEEQGVSRLIQSIPLADINTLSLSTMSDYYQILKEQARVEAYEEENVALALDQSEPISIKGGSTVLKLQALCPFRAFAQIRLTAKSQHPPEWGLGYRERGILLHQSLDFLWNIIKSFEQLISLSEEDLLHCIDNAIQLAINKLQYNILMNSSALLLENEQQRLKKQLVQLMLLEKQREPFIVKSCEEKLVVTLGRLQLELRIDRIDELANNRYVVLDYKSGIVNAVDWLDEQLTESQLPLYATHLGQDVVAIAFAQVQTERVVFKGIASDGEILPDVKAFDNWPDLQSHWQRVLLTLAEQFYQGDARVAPKNGEQTCRGCELHGLCRINAIELTDK